jgi:Tfp pilus assembly protein PilV
MAAEAGFGLVEVMVSAVVIVLVATATVTSISESQKTSARTLSRGVVANLAEQDQERMRSMRAKDLADYKATRIVVQEKIKYKVESQGEFVVDKTGDAVSCTSTGAQTSYLKLTSTVTPQAGFKADPLTLRSIQALPVSQYSPTSGTLITPVVLASGLPATGVTVQLSGPESRSATTNAAGCAIFQFLTPGAYTIAVNQGGWVDQSQTQNVSYSGTVSPGNTNTATPLVYDRWGAIAPVFDSGATKAGGITVTHASIVAPGAKTKTYPVAGASGLFPFTSPYSVYAGTCTANDPTTYAPEGATFYADHPGYGQALVKSTSPATTVAPNLHEPAITPPQIQVMWRNSAGTTLTEKPSTSGNTARVYLKPADAGCTLPTVPVVNADANGNPTGTAKLPYGNYKLCAEYTKTVTGKDKQGVYSKVAGYNAANTKWAGVNGLTTLVIDTVAGGGDTNKKPCTGAGAVAW